MGIAYVNCGDYYIPDLALLEEKRPIGKWGRMHREYLKQHNLILHTNLIQFGKLWSYLADLNEQSQGRLDTLVSQMKDSEGITEALDANGPNNETRLGSYPYGYFKIFDYSVPWHGLNHPVTSTSFYMTWVLTSK